MELGRIRDVDAEKNTVDSAVIAELDAKLAEDPKNPELWFAKGQEYFGIEFDRAIDCFSMAIALKPFHYDYYFNRGRKYFSLDQWERGLADFVMSIRLDPTDGLEWHYAGVCCFYMDRYDEAANYFKKAIEAHRANGTHLVWPEVDWIYMAYMRSGKPEEAIQALDLVGNDEPVEITDYFYKKRVELYKKLVTPEEYLAKLDRHSNLDAMTELYALANYYYYQANEPEKSMAVIDEILAMPDYHHAFGYKSSVINKKERSK